MSRLRIKDLSFLERAPISLIVEPGECVCLSGPSGAGKTLLLRSIADLDVHLGSVYLDDIQSMDFEAPEWRKKIGMLPAEGSWWFDNVGDHFTSYNESYLNRLGINKKVMSYQVSQLSTGERQRLALIRLLGNQPEALLLDEPTATLDAENVANVEKLVAEYSDIRHAPVLWISHDINQINRIASRHFVIGINGLEEQSLGQ